MTALPAILAGPPAILAGPPAILAGPPAILAGPPAILAGPPAILAGPPAILAGPRPRRLRQRLAQISVMRSPACALYRRLTETRFAVRASTCPQLRNLPA